MSYDEQSGRPVSPDRTIQLISEARDHDDFLYRTLFGNKSLPHVVYQLEHFTILFDVVNDVRRRTLEKFHKLHRNTLIATTSIDGRMLNVLTETRIKHTTEAKIAKKSGFGGGGGDGGGGGNPFG
jgi:uncharacterized membrane protein YgcG|tara:strand:- start:90 stop:464 length:375 start_codon:yes stop_codon:yes gene_type:complete